MIDQLDQQLDQTQECLETACEEAKSLEQDQVGTEDILLGILKDTRGLATDILHDFGVKFESAKSEVQKILSQRNSGDSASPNGATASTMPETGQIELSEKGRSPEGRPISFDRRLFMQFTAFRNLPVADLSQKFRDVNAQAVIYQDVNDFASVGVMSFFEDPGYLVDVIQPCVQALLSEAADQKTEFTMLGRTYSIGYENDLEEVLLTRPGRRVCDPATPWAVYYPVRRSGRFEKESREEQRKMLMEHGGIGHAFGKAGFATDIRLAGHGLNSEDNDFIIGLLGKELFPLSALVQRMRRTRQTSEFIESMGPFFVGRAVYQPDYATFDSIR